MKPTLAQWYAGLWGVFLFSLSSNWFFKVVQPSSYVYGLLVDYLIPKLYLFDFLALGLVGSWLVWENHHFRQVVSEYWRTHRQLVLILSFGWLAMISVQPTGWNWLSLVTTTRLVVMATLALFLVSHQSLLKAASWWWWVVGALGFQSLLALYQAIAQRALIGYSLLGEPALERGFGLAKTVWNGRELILPYGTTPHPNILAGLIVMGLVALWSQRPQVRSRSYQASLLVITGLSLFTLWLTQSVSAWLSLVTLCLVWLFNLPFIPQKIAPAARHNLIISVLGFFLLSPLMLKQAALRWPDQPSLTRRDLLNEAAIIAWQNNPFFGLGSGQFTAKVENYSQSREVVRFVQPAHHVGLLWLSEYGLAGVVWVAVVGWLVSSQSSLKKNVIGLAVLLPLASLDHYLLTQPSWWYLLTVYLAFRDQV